MRIRVAGAALVLVSALLAGQRADAAIEVSDAWTRVTPPGVTVAVGYFTLKNTSAGGRELLKITSPLAERISLHRSSVDANGVSRMWPVGKLELAPGEVRRFEPNGYHLMLEGLSAPLRAGLPPLGRRSCRPCARRRGFPSCRGRSRSSCRRRFPC